MADALVDAGVKGESLLAQHVQNTSGSATADYAALYYLDWAPTPDEHGTKPSPALGLIEEQDVPDAVHLDETTTASADGNSAHSCEGVSAGRDYAYAGHELYPNFDDCKLRSTLDTQMQTQRSSLSDEECVSSCVKQRFCVTSVQQL